MTLSQRKQQTIASRQPLSACGSSTVHDLCVRFAQRAAEAEREGATALVAKIYRLVIEDLSVVNEVPAMTPPSSAEVPELERYLTPQQLEERLHLPSGYAYRHQRQLGGVKVGKYVRFPESAVRRRLERSRDSLRAR